MKLKVDLFFIALILLVVFLLYRMSQPGYWEYKQKQAEMNLEFTKKLLGKEGFRGMGGGSGSAYQEIGFADLQGAELQYQKRKEGFYGRGGSGAAYQEIDFKDMSEEDKKKLKEGFYWRGGGGQAIGGRGSGSAYQQGSGAPYDEDDFKDMTEEDKKQLKEAFQNISPSEDIQGSTDAAITLSPGPASLKQPRKPYNLLEQLPPAPRGSISCLNASCCAETDFEWRTNLTGNYLQRTNNYKREFPDSCSAPLTELNLAFYKNSVLSKQQA